MLRRVAVKVAADDAEIARARMLGLAPGGFEELEVGGGLELAAYVDPDGEASIREVFGDVSSNTVADGWESRWREFHRPVRAGGLWIGPPWEARPPGESAVVVDPGLAFGTGAHPTTRGCIELLAGQMRGSVLDAGCGSAVLSVAAARLGFSPVHAIDADPLAVEVARRTVAENGVEVEVRAADALADDLPGVDLLVANIELDVVEELLARAPAARAITAGYLVRQRPAAERWEHVERLELEGWAIALFTAPD